MVSAWVLVTRLAGAPAARVSAGPCGESSAGSPWTGATGLTA